MNKDLRRKVVDMVVAGNDGHIPSAFSIIDIITYIYAHVLKFDASKPDDPDRDYFVLSKGHGCLALYVNLHRHGIITDKDIEMFCKKGGILGEHPDKTKVPGAEASTGSLGHGLSFSLGIALGHKIKGMNNKLYVLIGDGESHEGTVWEAAHVAANHKLKNLTVIVDWNQSGMQLLPEENMQGKWDAFGWHTIVIDGHDEDQIAAAFEAIQNKTTDRPSVIIANTIKGKGVPMIEGHGAWHHRIPNPEEYAQLMGALA
ncbi:MAG: transketolase [Magnetovibrio sp.]|nr:transketolase [Magnetovibrio sp.]